MVGIKETDEPGHRLTIFSTPTNADDVNITPRVSELTVRTEDKNEIPCDSSIKVLFPTVSPCSNDKSMTNACNKFTTVKTYSLDRATSIQKGCTILRRWQLCRQHQVASDSKVINCI